MTAVSTYTKSGTKATTAAKLDANVFGIVPTNHELLKQAYVTHLANSRDNLARTKTRGEVRGGGKKPWAQKGTGRARFGSSRVPIWRGGGITFGPTGEENYTKRLNTKARRLAIRQALSLAAQADNIKVIESFESKEGKTSHSANFLQKIEARGRVLLVLGQKDENIQRATNNLSGVQVVQAMYLSVFRVMNADVIVFSKDALELVSLWLGVPAEESKTKASKEGTK